MANEVYANGREVVCKAGSSKTIAAFPDVCLSPPSPPAGPIPIPYPNTASAGDTTNGSKTVQICGQEVMLKDQSAFKTSTGDEAATKSFGMGVVTHQITGELSFSSWSMDVKFEGANVDRHLDLTLHNEQSLPDQTPPLPHAGKQAVKPPCGKAEDLAEFADQITPEGKGSSYVVAGAVHQSPDLSVPQAYIGSSRVSGTAVQDGERLGHDERFMAPGIKQGQKSNVPCKKSKTGYHQYKQDVRAKEGHAEAKIIETVFANAQPGLPTGTLYLKVVGKKVCPDCRALIDCAKETIDIKEC